LKKDRHYSFAFYNLENLFDTKNDPATLDDDFTEASMLQWTETRFEKKVKKLGKVISQIGYDHIGFPPVILGVAEVENRYVLERLVNSKFLESKGYSFAHFDSPDERGIDNALLYRKEFFEIIHSYSHTVYITNEFGERDFTRDVLEVYGKLEGHPIHILVNHWPSRRSGTEETSIKREIAAKKNLEIMQSILDRDPEARIIVMGDFNDDPKSLSIQLLVKNGLYNPMEQLLTQEEGSLSHDFQWHLFDQILLSHNFLQLHNNAFKFDTAVIFHPKNLQEYRGRYKGLPFRTFVGKKYKGGVSDHFPVYCIFTIEK